MIAEEVTTPKLGLGLWKWKERRDISETQIVLILSAYHEAGAVLYFITCIKTWKWA